MTRLKLLLFKNNLPQFVSGIRGNMSCWYGAVVLARVEGRLRVLVVNCAKRGGRVELPKGGEEPDDGNPYGTALRELSEETGMVDLQGRGAMRHAWFTAQGERTTVDFLVEMGRSGWVVFRWDAAPEHLVGELLGDDAANNPRFVDVEPNPVEHPQQRDALPRILRSGFL